MQLALLTFCVICLLKLKFLSTSTPISFLLLTFPIQPLPLHCYISGSYFCSLIMSCLKLSWLYTCLDEILVATCLTIFGVDLDLPVNHLRHLHSLFPCRFLFHQQINMLMHSHIPACHLCIGQTVWVIVHPLVVCHSLPVDLWILSYSQTFFDFCLSNFFLPILLFALITHNFSVFLTAFCVGLYQTLS